ncbi:trans-1,2-dihydrobenzene-1,2-diol dehydrogenase, partial [Tetranychus urticae]|uniref:trans-1,2-dihydrobenzene-1,2-diol dehydrogenase n=1 Tax=Tetranychus urticae TaxID=32264 RepID=UPI000D652F98
MATKWGILSAGKISHDFTVCLRSLDPAEHQAVAVAARNIGDALKFAANHKIPRAYGSYQELANDPNVEVVYIGTLVSFHYSTTKMMLEAGKHVLVEKSFTATSKEARELINLARSKKLFLMEAIWSRFNPVFTLLMDKIKTKALGDVVSVNATFGLDLTKVERLIKKAAGGGTLLDLGVYTINVIQVAVGNKKPEQILATGHLNEDGVDESVAVAFKYSDGQVAMMSNTLRGQMPNE